MSKRRQADRQLHLFERRLAWHEFPERIREPLIRLFTTLCVEIVDETHPHSEVQEQRDESTKD